MTRGLRMRSRLLLAFLGTYVVLTVLTGVVGWWLLHALLLDQAQERAATIGRLGSYLFTNERILTEMEELTGYRIQVLDARQQPAAGTIAVQDALGRQLEIDYRNDSYRQAEQTVLWGTVGIVLAGTVVFACAAWLVARNIARPLERLQSDLDSIGAGQLEQPLRRVGGGEIAELSHHLEDMRRRLVELDRQHRQAERLATLGTFTATIAHEVRNPLSAVQLAVQMLARKQPDDASLVMIRQEIDRLDLILDGLLAFSRGMQVELQPCRPRKVAEAVIAMLQRQADHAGVTLQLADGDDPEVLADPARLKQLLMNLVINGMQAQHGDGVVEVALRHDGFAVRDQGPGIAPALRERIFEAFTTNKPEGTGLGLHIAKSIVDAHGASIDVVDAQPGCIFIVSGLRRVDTRRNRKDGVVDG